MVVGPTAPFAWKISGGSRKYIEGRPQTGAGYARNRGLQSGAELYGTSKRWIPNCFLSDP